MVGYSSGTQGGNLAAKTRSDLSILATRLFISGSGDTIFQLAMSGYNGSAYINVTNAPAKIVAFANGAWSAGVNQGVGLQFFTTPNGSTTRNAALVLQSGIYFGSGASPTDRGAGWAEAQNGFWASGSQGLSCSGSPSSSFASVGGIVTHC